MVGGRARPGVRWRSVSGGLLGTLGPWGCPARASTTVRRLARGPDPGLAPDTYWRTGHPPG
jgi:hypothetical protein